MSEIVVPKLLKSDNLSSSINFSVFSYGAIITKTRNICKHCIFHLSCQSNIEASAQDLHRGIASRPLLVFQSPCIAPGCKLLATFLRRNVPFASVYEPSLNSLALTYGSAASAYRRQAALKNKTWKTVIARARRSISHLPRRTRAALVSCQETGTSNLHGGLLSVSLIFGHVLLCSENSQDKCSNSFFPKNHTGKKAEERRDVLLIARGQKCTRFF